MVVMEKFFCAELRPVVLIATWIDLVASVLLTSAFGWSFVVNMQNIPEDNPRDAMGVLIAGFSGILAVYSAVHAIVAVLQLHGVLKNKAGFMLPWIILNGARIALTLIWYVAQIRDAVLRGQPFTFSICAIILDAIIFYVFLAVIAYYQVLRKRTSEGAFRSLS